jgi:hypothetical protein
MARPANFSIQYAFHGDGGDTLTLPIWSAAPVRYLRDKALLRLGIFRLPTLARQRPDLPLSPN